MANFPTSIPSITNPSGTDNLNSPAHATIHANVNDEVTAVATKVGVNSSAVTTSHDYKLSSITADAKAVSTAGDQTIGGKKTFGPTVQTVTAASDGATVTFDLSLGNIHTITLGGNRTLAISNETAGQVFVIKIKQDATPPRTVTWFSTISWAGGIAPTLTATASKTDVFGFITTAADTYDGFIIGSNL
jgi:hypothetical protein